MDANQNTKSYKHTSKGLNMLRIRMGVAIGRNQYVSFSPSQCVAILQELDKEVKRYQNKIPAYKTKRIDPKTLK